VAKKATKAAKTETAAVQQRRPDPKPPEVSFGPARKELKILREKLQKILDTEGENLTILDIILKIDKLDRVLICQVDMTRSF